MVELGQSRFQRGIFFHRTDFFPCAVADCIFLWSVDVRPGLDKIAAIAIEQGFAETGLCTDFQSPAFQIHLIKRSFCGSILRRLVIENIIDGITTIIIGQIPFSGSQLLFQSAFWPHIDKDAGNHFSRSHK